MLCRWVRRQWPHRRLLLGFGDHFTMNRGEGVDEREEEGEVGEEGAEDVEVG